MFQPQDLERIAQVAVELGAARATVAQKQEELTQLLKSFAQVNQISLLSPLQPEQRLPIRREAHGEMLPKLLLAMRTEVGAGGSAIFDARRIAHLMDCSQQTAAIRLKRACDRGHIKRVEPGRYALMPGSE